MLKGSENQKYCTSITFISDKETIRKAYCDCPISKKVKNYWCKHVWAVVIAHCPDEELIKLVAIASAEYIEDMSEDSNNIYDSPPSTPNNNVKISKNIFHSESSDSIIKTLEFSPPPKSSLSLLRRSADEPLKESPYKIPKLNKSSNDVALVSPIKAGTLPLMSHEIIMILFDSKIFDINVAVAKQEIKDRLKLKTFDKILSTLLTRGNLLDNLT